MELSKNKIPEEQV